jgi:hypothetical protein
MSTDEVSEWVVRVVTNNKLSEESGQAQRAETFLGVFRVGLEVHGRVR